MDAALETYLRSGEVVSDLRRTPPDARFFLPDEWFGSVPLPVNRTRVDLYAMPVATREFLADKTTDLRDLIIKEVNSVWSDQMKEAKLDSIGPVSVLRDPYSAKPYVLFYVTAKAFRSAAPTS